MHIIVKNTRKSSSYKKKICDKFKNIDLYGKQVTLTYKGDEYE